MSDGTTHRQLVVFSLGDEEYALPISRVHEIIRYTEPRSVAADAVWIRGVISLRGKIVPVYDLAARLGLELEGSREANIVIAEAGNGVAGVVVDDVDQVLTVEEGEIEEVPSGNEAIEAIVKVGDRLVLLLDVDGIFADAAATAAA